jgi:hypothetical protein
MENADAVIEPPYPTLWLTGIGVLKEGLFGQTVRIDPWS